MIPPDGALFGYEARRDGRIVAQLVGRTDPSGVVVEATVTPFGAPPEHAVMRPFTFADTDHAERFVTEALVAFEYLDCEIVD